MKVSGVVVVEGFLFFLVVLLVLIVWAVFTQTRARQQISVPTSLSQVQVVEVCEKHFGILWGEVEGPGHLNFRVRMRMGPPTISVNCEPTPGGGCEVGIWMSGWTSRVGVVTHGQLVWRKKRALARKLLAPA